MASLWKECVNFFYSQVGKDKSSSYELNKGTSVYRQAQGKVLWGKLLSMITTRATKSKSKKQFPTWNQNWLPPCNTSTIMKTTLPGYFNFFQGKLEIWTVEWNLPSLLQKLQTFQTIYSKLSVWPPNQTYLKAGPDSLISGFQETDTQVYKWDIRTHLKGLPSWSSG